MKITTEDTRGDVQKPSVSFKDDITAISKLNENLNPQKQFQYAQPFTKDYKLP